MLKWSDGTTYDANKNSFERPFLYRDEKGIPRLLFGTFSVHNIWSEERAYVQWACAA